MLAAPDKFYLWSPQNRIPDSAPDYVADAKPLLRPYFERMGSSAGSVSSQSLELFVYAWLSEVLSNRDPGSIPDWVRDSGLLDAIRGARLRRQASH
jgi:hypothetical protein